MKKRLAILLACVLAVSVIAGAVISASAAEKPEASLPTVLISGFSYELPALEGKTAFVNGTEANGSFVAEGERVTVEYKASSDAAADASYIIPVVDTKNASDHCAYFYSPNGTVRASETSDYIALSASADGEATFANALNASAFSVNMEFSAATNYSALELVLTDASNREVSLTASIDPNGEIISGADQSAEFSGGMLLLKYDNRACSFQDSTTGESLLTFTVDDKGDAFTGFSNGVYMTLRFVGVNGSSEVYLKRLVNQPLGHRDAQIADQTEPTIALAGALDSKQSKGSKLEIPAAEGFDVFSQITGSTITVKSPSGAQLYSGDFAGYVPVEITENGKYQIVYRAEDSHGNAAELTRTVFVNDDVAPELNVSELKKTSYKQGDAVELPSYTASDNLGVCTVDVILILPNSELRLLSHDENGSVTYYTKNTDLYLSSFGVSDTSFCAEQTGRYVLRFVAYDDIYNRTVVELPFDVK